MLFAVIAIAAVLLTATMFGSRQMVLGFPCLIFWAILGGYCFQQSTLVWDIYYLMFFGSFGMAIFCAFAAYSLRTKKEEMAAGEEYIDEGKDDMKFIDEGGSEDGDKPRKRVRNVRERAALRRERLN